MSIVRLSAEDCTGYYVIHKDLIRSSYYEYDSNAEKIHELRGDLFSFTERPQPSSPKRRRKRKQHNSIDSNTPSTSLIDLNSIKTKSEKLISQCKQNITITEHPNPTTEDVNRILQTSAVFPKFHGKNDSNATIVTEIFQHKYLIPTKCKFYNDDIMNCSEILTSHQKFDFIVLDPPWRNKYIRRLKSAQSNLSYKMITNEDLVKIPIEQYTHENTLVAIWCTNSSLHHKAVLETFIPKWKLKLLATWYWVKLTQKGDVVCPFRDVNQKQPFEHLFIAGHEANESLHMSEEFVLSVASVIHSHKPPLLELFKDYLPKNPKCLELFARYLHPCFTSVGLEVLKLQDIHFYDLQTNNK